MMYVFLICLITLIVSAFIMWKNVMRLISTDTLVDAADTALGENPIRTTRDNIYAGITKHVTNAIIIVLSAAFTIASGITWLITALIP